MAFQTAITTGYFICPSQSVNQQGNKPASPEFSIIKSK